MKRVILSNTNRARALLLATWLLLGGGPFGALPRAAADEPAAFERASAALRRATVTVRVIPPAQREGESSAGTSSPGQDVAKPNEEERESPSVLVCSGVSLGEGRVVSFLRPPAGSRIRITTPAGEQADARLGVVDHVSGLVLLNIEDESWPGLPFAEEIPAAGGWVVTAAGWGAEAPAVSFGILSAVDRTLPGTATPVLQCQLPIADTSSGSAIVDRAGGLLGVIVATEPAGDRTGWTYAVPVRHVERLLAADRARHTEAAVVVLQRRRPVVGLVLDTGDMPESVVVRRVAEGGPAERAGIAVGDHILAADGVRIRSVYQAVRPVLFKQPGDTIRYLVQSSEGEREVLLTLEGSLEVPGDSADAFARLFPPRLEVNRERIGRLRLEETVGFQAGDANRAGPRGGTEPTAEKLQLLERALDRYRDALAGMREEMQRREQEHSRMMEELEGELRRLQEQVAP